MVGKSYEYFCCVKSNGNIDIILKFLFNSKNSTNLSSLNTLIRQTLYLLQTSNALALTELNIDKNIYY